ncbi:MAG TPA: lipopolysaccharide kinase InaA family protein [Pirellulales bacterium]|nr:lipopolysaccharide kinase InaA family protein [Pirellulales bacterium]
MSAPSGQRTEIEAAARGDRARSGSSLGQLWIASEYAASLEQAGLARFEAIVSTTHGRLLRRLADRENRRFELHLAHRGTRGMYLKTHRTRSWRSWLRARLGVGPGTTPGGTEAEHIARLQRLGVATMPLVAWGQRLGPDGTTESFVLTEELAGFTQLDHFLRRRFPHVADRPTVDRRPAPRDGDLRQLIRGVADVAARFHGLGFNHRDFYCCHFFIRETLRGRFDVHLIDLQRVEERRWFRRRWLVKDLGQLAYSAPCDRVSRSQRMAFIKRYLGVRKLRRADKRLIRAVLARHRALEHRHGAHP